MRLGAVLTLLFMLVAVGRALQVEAHAQLDHGDPPADAHLATAPAKITLFFVQGLVPSGSWVTVASGDGVDMVSDIAFDPANKKVMTATLRPLAPGRFTVKWQSLSSDDDDYAGGTYEFTVLNADGTDPAPSAAAARSVASHTGGGSPSPVLILIGGAGVAMTLIGLTALIQRRRRA